MTTHSQGSELAVPQSVVSETQVVPSQSAVTGASRTNVSFGSNASAAPDSILSGTNAYSIHSDMVLIPGGSFLMGNGLDPMDGDADELPMHRVQVSAFYMDKFVVTEELWGKVFTWATNHGYEFAHGIWGKAPKHPIICVSWFDSVKWCNARSEMEGLRPAYFTDSDLTMPYRSGEATPFVNWTSGYRLPTEAEWEKAARGGLEQKRFPWGDTISLKQANYYALPSGYTYDVNKTSGYHPAFKDQEYPLTSPVDYFSANDYGLYDMAGNVRQWCWDWYGKYPADPQSDPRGPDSGSARVFRGGSWGANAFRGRIAARYYYFPTYKSTYVGFRTVLSAPSESQ